MQAGLSRAAHGQRGSFMLEALISVIIFSIGLISLIGVSSQAINMVGQSKARNDASYLAGELIGEMWVSASAPAAFNTAAWIARVQDPKNLPGGQATVVVVGNTVDISITWIDKKDPGATPHLYRTVAEIARNP